MIIIRTFFQIPGMMLAVLLFACQNPTTTHIESVVKDSALNTSVKNDSSKDTVISFNGSKLSMLPVNCNQPSNDSIKAVRDFMNSNIRYFKSDTIIVNQLYAEMYYRSFLTETHFLEFELSSFNTGNFTFSVAKSAIKDYGICYIGKYFFPAAVNAAQRRAIVIISKEKKEISIWNFDDVNVSKNGLVCDFNVRGIHTLYKMNYSAKCKSFIVQ